MSTNDGGPVVKVEREPVAGPDIPRGAMSPRLPAMRGEERLTFDLVTGGYRLTYHDVGVISDGTQTALQVFVTPHDVVTWERL